MGECLGVTRWSALLAFFAVLGGLPLQAATPSDTSSDFLKLLPVSRHQQFLSFALWDEEKSGVATRSDGKGGWSAVGGAVALLEAPQLGFRPQLVVSAAVDLSYRAKPGAVFDFESETFDGRFGLAIESILGPSLRLSIGVLHLSGHAADAIADRDLVGPNLGDDLLPIRLIYDWENRARLGITFKPVIAADPSYLWFAADQFLEWYPWLGTDENFPGSPFVAAGFQENGITQIELTYHIQAGIYFGNHFGPISRPTVRLSLGYYHGWDPRLKFQQLKQAHAQFFYAAVWMSF